VKAFFLLTLAALIAVSVIAARTKPQAVSDDKLRLIWTSDDNPLRRAQIEPFNAIHPELHLELDPMNADLEKVMVQSLAGVGPDLFDCWSGYHLSAFVKAGIAWDVTDELKKLGVDINATWPAVQPCAVYEGRVYGFPVNAAVNGLWFHRDLIEQAGVEIPKGPWTWQQAIPILQKLIQRDERGKVTRYPLVLNWENSYPTFLYQWGASLYTPDGTRSALDSPQAIAAMRFMQDLIFKYGIAPDMSAEKTMAAAGGWGGGDVITLFGARRSATALGGRYWLCALRNPEYAQLRLGLAEAPYGIKHTFFGYGKATLINKNSPHRYEALKFLQYLASEPYNKLINHQADGVGPVMKYVFEPSFLFDPAYPNETDNAVWRELQSAAQGEQVSPFMNGAVMQRLMQAQLDLIRSGDVSAERGMKEAARRVNARIQENLRQSPALRAEWERRVAASRAS
jgi:ABC-type glycerol-3-phosphate transport system substrate-binding protein